VFALLVSSCSRTKTVARLDAGSGTQIVVSADNWWEVSRPCFYEVHRDGLIVVPLTFIGSGLDFDLSFRLVITTDRKLVALVEASSPDVVLALFDLASNETWPHTSDNEEHTSAHQRGTALLARLKHSHPTIPFILSEDVLGSRRTKL
jgi:hypothetical protein